MADETNGGVTAGDRVTFVDTNGEQRTAICSHVHGPSTIDVVHRADGDFDDRSAGEFVEKTSVTPAEELDDPYAYIDGWSP